MSDRPDTLPAEQRIELLHLMLRIREFEDRVAESYLRGLTAGSMFHLSVGEEAVAAGVGTAMEPGDCFTTHHRGHGIFLARGADPGRMFAEVFGRREGYCGGKGGSMHIADAALGQPPLRGAGRDLRPARRGGGRHGRGGGPEHGRRPPGPGPRDREEEEAWKRQDPVEVQKKRLVEAGLLSDEAFSSLLQEVGQEMDRAVARAAAGSLPEPGDLFTHVYGD